MSIDGYGDHTAGIPDEEIHNHYTDLLRSADTILYGRTTYELMEDYWPRLIAKPSGTKSMDNFAMAIDNIEKVVFSNTRKSFSWYNTRLATQSLEEEIKQLKQQTSKDFFVGSPGLISQATALNLIDEYQLCVHPVVAGHGLRLFKDVPEMFQLKLVNTKVFGGGAVIHYYSPVNK